MLLTICAILALVILVPVAIMLLKTIWWTSLWILSIPMHLLVAPVIYLTQGQQAAYRFNRWVGSWIKPPTAAELASIARQKHQAEQLMMMAAVGSMTADKIIAAQRS